MKRWLLKTVYFFVSVLFWTTHAVVIVSGDGSLTPTPPAAPIPTTFSVAVKSKVFDRATGALYVGLLAGANPINALSKINRFNGSASPAFTPIATNPLLAGQQIDYLALAGEENSDVNTTLALVTNPTGNFQSQPVVTQSSTDGKTVVLSVPLLDASGAVGTSGTITSGIAQIAANSLFIFAAVRPAPMVPNTFPFGAPNSGIALITTDQTTTFSPLQIAAVDGDTGIKAQKLDSTISQITFAGSNPPGIVVPSVANNSVTLNWNSKLQRLFIGLQLSGAGNPVSDGAKSVIVASIIEDAHGNNKLTFNPIAPDSAFAVAVPNYIVGVIGGTNQNLSAIDLRVMHTSTGASYLIVHGGNGTVGTIANGLYALPLVDVGDPTNVTQGTLANKNAFNAATGRFETPAAANGDLVTTADTFAQVGGSPLPGLQINDSLFDIVVVGDTVFATPNVLTPPTTTPDFRGGIFYSQALFDDVGKIVSWTPWTKRAIPFDAFPYALNPNKGFVFLFDVDAVNAKLWAIDFDGRTVITTAWDTGSFATKQVPPAPIAPSQNPLVLQLNDALSKGCFSVLDLDQSTPGLGMSAPGRYALFGGLTKIVFVRTSLSTAMVPPFDIVGGIPVTQSVLFTDPTIQPPVNPFEDPILGPQLFLETTLPSGCAVKVLEYSRRVAGTADNYFFAGTDDGLYVFAGPGGTGFDVGTTPPNALNGAPFSTGQWQKVAAIQGAVIDIKTSGNTLYVLTLQTSANAPITSIIYKIPFDTTIAAMFTPGNMFNIAESGVDAVDPMNILPDSDLGAATIILGMQIIATGDPTGVGLAPAAKEQLVIATNQGLFESNTDQTANNGIIDAMNQLDAQWLPVDPNDTTMYYNIMGIDTPIRHTIWPISILDLQGLRTFVRGGIKQLSGIGNPGGTMPMIGGFVPPNFHSIDPTNQFFNTFDATTNFWSDGARRFLIVFRQQDGSTIRRLLVTPYDTIEWAVSDPRADVLVEPLLTNNDLFFWVKQIGATGILMAGTESGIIALE